MHHAATALVLTLALAPFAYAQEADTGAPTPNDIVEDTAWSTDLTLNAAHLHAFEADIDDSDASVTTSITRFGARLGWTRPDRRLAFGVGFRGSVGEFEFENASTLVPTLDDDPFDTFLSQRFELDGRYAFNRTWGLAGFFGVESAYESGADFGDALQGGGALLALWTNADATVTWGFGLGGFTRLDEDPIVFPLVTVRWQIDDVLRLESERLGLRLTYDVCDEVDVSVFGRFDRIDYRLADDRGAASDGSLRDNRIAIGATLAWSPEALDGFTLSLTGGALIYRDIQILDDDGDELFEDQADPSAFLGLSISYTF